MRDLGHFPGTNMTDLLNRRNAISQHGGWGFLIAGMIFAITFFATRDWALALNLPV